MMGKYRSLKTLYHQDPTRQKTEYTARLTCKDTLRLPLSVNGYPAFIVMGPDIQNSLGIIRNLNQNIRDLYPETWDLSTVLAEEIRMSNEIEGISDLKDNQVTGSNTPHAGECLAYRQLSEGRKRFPETPEELRSLYDRMLLPEIIRQDPGSAPDGILFRTEPVCIHDGLQVCHAGISSEAVITEQISVLLDLCRDAEIPIPVRAAILQFFLGYIHPFYDGNGRISRYLCSLLLSSSTGMISALFLSQAIRRHRNRYYREFKKSEHPLNCGELTEFVLMFLQMIQLSAQLALESSGISCISSEPSDTENLG